MFSSSKRKKCFLERNLFFLSRFYFYLVRSYARVPFLSLSIVSLLFFIWASHFFPCYRNGELRRRVQQHCDANEFQCVLKRSFKKKNLLLCMSLNCSSEPLVVSVIDIRVFRLYEDSLCGWLCLYWNKHLSQIAKHTILRVLQCIILIRLEFSCLEKWRHWREKHTGENLFSFEIELNKRNWTNEN